MRIQFGGDRLLVFRFFLLLLRLFLGLVGDLGVGHHQVDGLLHSRGILQGVPLAVGQALLEVLQIAAHALGLLRGLLLDGFFIGLLPIYGAKIGEGVFNVKHAIIYAIVTVLGVGIGFGLVTPLLTVLFYSSELTVTWIQAEAAIISDASVAVVVGIPVLFALARRNARKTNLSKED